MIENPDAYVIGMRKAGVMAKVHFMTVFRWVHEGYVKAFKESGVWYIDRKSLMNYAYPDGITVDQAVQYCGLPKGTIYEWAKTKRVKATLQRGRCLICTRSLDAYLDKREKIERDYFTFREAQMKAGIYKTTLRRWLQTGQIKSQKFDGIRWLERESFLEFLAKKQGDKGNLMEMQKKYQVRRFAGYINVSSSGHYTADMVFKWGPGIRLGHFCIGDFSIIFPRKGKNKNASVVTQYPKYLKIDILRCLYAGLMGNALKFYEYTQHGVERYEGLRYHTDLAFYDFALRISKQLMEIAPGDMVSIFNACCHPSETPMNTTSGDGDLVKITHPAYMRDGQPKVGVHRLDTDRRDNWALEFIAPVFQSL